MALIHCPECNREVSETAELCPHCGYNLAKKLDFEVKTSQLSKPEIRIGKRIAEIIGGIVLIGIGLPLLSAVIGIVPIILGLISFCLGLFEKPVQKAKCPYCETPLLIKPGGNTFRCPKCNNCGKKTETSLETTHKA